MTSETETDGYFGLCPECHKTDGYMNIGRTHVFTCEEHGTWWIAGSNLFSCWREETELEWRRNAKRLDSWREVRPYRRHEHTAA